MALQNRRRLTKPTSLKMPALVRSQIRGVRHLGTEGTGDRQAVPAAARTSS
jgi:hypothetical protein